MSYQHLRLDRRGAITIVTIDRSRRANSLSHAVLVELEHCAHSFRDDAMTRAVILIGAGKHFSSGADLDGFEFPDEEPLVLKRRRTRMGARAFHAWQDIDQITIAAWRGAAMGGGACIATALDFRIGADDCFMQYPEVDLGLNLMWESLPTCVHLVGPHRAKRLVAGGERICGPELEAWGLLDKRVPADDVLDTALAFAENYAAKPPVAVQMIKQSVNRIAGALDRALMHMDTDQNLLTRRMQDHKHAVRQYRARQTAHFSGD